MQQTNTLPTEVEKRFDDIFECGCMRKDRHYNFEDMTDGSEIKKFIASEIQEAVKNERERIQSEVKVWKTMTGTDLFHPMAAKKLCDFIASLSPSEGEQ